MKRVFVLIAVAILSWAPVSAAPLSNEDKATMLVQRVANMFGQGGNAEVAIGKIVKGAPAIPMPTEELVGSVHVSLKNAQPNDAMGEMTTLYYVGLPDSASRYKQALLSAGWTSPMFPGQHVGGFVSSEEGTSEGIYCKKNAPTIMMQATGVHKDDFRVIATHGVGMDVMCDPTKMMQEMIQAQSLLPELQAPAGTQMDVAQAGNTSGHSGAHIRGASSPKAVLAEFGKQMVSAGWTAGATSTSDAIASASYHIEDSKKTPWQCLITVYTVDGKPGEVIAFIDLTDLSKLKK